ncbi:MAG: peptide chain release factor 2 [Elusimicrobia bacterium]|nr:peptide chain release factor 2 [Elusimicrobiota bacterium]
MDVEIQQKLEEIKEQYEKLKSLFDVKAATEKIEKLTEKTLSKNLWSNPSEAGKILKELDGLKKQVEAFDSLKKRVRDFAQLAQMYSEEDAEISELKKEADQLNGDLRQMNLKFQFSSLEDFKNAIVTLHAGAGGTEACDWCEMLLRMYMRWCERRNFATKIISILPGDEAGIKSVTFKVAGDFAYGYLKSEAGVHRLVRVSPFDANKRRHTSFASCDVIPEIDENFEIDIKPDDLKIDTFRSSGHGGQHVNKTDSAVRITHIPSGIVVSCQNERSQHQNKAQAMALLKAKLYALEMDRQKEQSQRRYDKMGQIGWGYQIRSYVFMPYRLVKDLRTGFETSNVEAVMAGDIDGFIEAYLTKK